MEKPPPERADTPGDDRAHTPEGSRAWFRIAIALLVIFLVVPYAAVLVGSWYARDNFKEARHERHEFLFFKGDRLLVDGFRGDAARCYEEILDSYSSTDPNAPVDDFSDPDNPEALIRLEFCEHARSAVAATALRTKVQQHFGDEAPRALRQLVEAELCVMEGDVEGAHDLFEAALANGDERLRYAVLHHVDHMREWAATREFCLSVRMPEVDNRRVLRRFALRPYVPLHLSLFVCTPAGEPRLVYPRAGVDEDVAVAAGECLVKEFFKDTGEWIFLPEDPGLFLCGVATRAEPDHDRIAKILFEAIGFATAGEAPDKTIVDEVRGYLDTALGSHRFVLIVPQY